jgi:molybdopterin-containing oxidoreductase family membrane subunit
MNKNAQIEFNPEKLNRVAEDLFRTVRINRSFLAWMTFLMLALAACLYAYYTQLRDGLSVTGLGDYTSWGMYIAHFVFFVATSLVGMLISSVMGLIGYKWIKPVARIAEIIAVAFAAVAGLVIVSDMGRPDRLPYVFMFGRVQSPIFWDVTVVTTYFVLSFILYYLTLIPDLAIGKKYLDGRPGFLKKAYEILSVRFRHTPLQYKILFRAIRIILILIVPMAFAIHTVTSWLFAVTPRAGWDSTIFGPYFLSGAFVAGTAAVIIAMYFFRKNYRLSDYLTDFHFDKIGKLLFLVSIVYLYFNINEYLVPAYKLKKFDAIHIKELFTGHYAILFYITQLGGLVIPLILLLLKPLRKPLPLMLISVVMLAAAWLKRYLIVVPVQGHPYLPIQLVPEKFVVYTPTVTEAAITLGSFLLVLIIITILSKLFPVISVWEVAATDHNDDSTDSVNQ